MTEEDKKGGVIRVPEDTKKAIEELSEKTGLKQGVIVAFLVDQCLRWKMLDPENPDWIERVRDEVRAEINATSTGDDRVRTAMTIAEHRAVLSAKTTIFKKHLDDMPIEQRREYTAKMLGIKVDSSNPLEYLENVSSLQLFKINGARQFHKAGKDGRPVIPGVKPEDLLKCSTGLHIRGSYCECPLYRSCKWRIEETQEREAALRPPSPYVNKALEEAKKMSEDKKRKEKQDE